MRIAICDDERIYRSSVSDAVNKWGLVKKNIAMSICSYASCEDILEALSNGDYFDIIFLDIQIPNEMSGLELARRIRQHNNTTIIVFITNYAEYACYGYQVNALRYICKPINEDQISECLEVAYLQWVYGQKEQLTLNTLHGIYVLKIRDILYVEAQSHRISFHNISRKEELSVRMSMNQLCENLPEGLLIKCHRSYLVNILYIRKILRTTLTLADGTELPIGKQNREALMRMFEKFYQGTAL